MSTHFESVWDTSPRIRNTFMYTIVPAALAERMAAGMLGTGSGRRRAWMALDLVMLRGTSCLSGQSRVETSTRALPRHGSVSHEDLSLYQWMYCTLYDANIS